MPFESVYRVSPRCVPLGGADVDALGRELGMNLPLGYHDFVTTLGPGELCDFLLVNMPDEIRNPSPHSHGRAVLDWFAQLLREENRSDILTPEDVEKGVVFAYSAERPLFIASRRLGPRLFELCDDWIVEIAQGFFGLVDLCASWTRHDFPFFEPHNGRRKTRGFDIRAGIGRHGFLDAVTRRWGNEGLRRSRQAADEEYPNLFVPAIGGRFELFLDPKYNRLPPDCFFVRAKYDTDHEADVAAFVESVLLPGGTSRVEQSG